MSNRAMREPEILKLVDALDRMNKRFYVRQKALSDSIVEARKKLKKCSHSRTKEFSWEHDDGYGRQRMCRGLFCFACGKKNHYPSLGGESWV